MQLVPGDGGVWHLIDETAPPSANLIAVLRGPVEILAGKGLCEVMLRPESVSAEFEFRHEGLLCRVTPATAAAVCRCGSRGIMGRCHGSRRSSGGRAEGRMTPERIAVRPVPPRAAWCTPPEAGNVEPDPNARAGLFGRRAWRVIQQLGTRPWVAVTWQGQSP